MTEKNDQSQPESAETSQGTRYLKVPGTLRYLVPFVVLGLGAGLIMAATGTWPFSAVSEVELSNGQAIEVKAGKLQLKRYYPSVRHDVKSEFSAGTHADTEYQETSLALNNSSIKTSESGLVSYYPFNGSTGAIANNVTTGIEDSKSTNEGIAKNTNGTGMVFATGRFANGINFDGIDDFVNIPAAAALSITGNLTVSAWINTDTLPSAPATIVGNTDDGLVPNYWFLLHNSASRIQLISNSYALIGTTSLAAGAWYHVAFVRSGSSGSWTYSLYVNGVLDATGYTTVNPISGTLLTTIGAAKGNGGINPAYLFDGKIDDVAIYNTALTADQIQAQAAAGSRIHMKAAYNPAQTSTTITPHAPKLSAGMAGLVAYWPMDESTGTTLTKDMAGANKGTLVGMVGGDHITGVNGKGLNTGNAKYISLGASSNLAGLQVPMTLSGWIKPAADSQPHNQQIYGAYAGTSDHKLWSMLYLVGSGGGGLVFYLSKSDGTLQNVPSGVTPLANVWRHVAVTVSGTLASPTVKIYVDGVQAISQAVAALSSTPDKTIPIAIGANATSSGGDGFVGQLDEFSVWNRALNAGEVAFLAGKKGEIATYTSPIIDGEVSTATWDKIKINRSKNQNTPQFQAQTIQASFTSTLGVYNADLDGDGDLDVVATGSNTVAWWANDGSGKFGSSQVIQASFNGASGVSAVDLDGDGDLDVVATAAADNEVAWWANNGSGGFGSKQSIQTAFAETYNVATADLDGDGDVDVVATSAGAGDEVAWWANNGSGTFGSKQSIQTSFDEARNVTTGDFDGDGDLDVVAVAYSGNEVAWWANNGSGTFGSKQSIQTSFTQATGITAADLDGDGDLDVAATAFSGNEVAWWANNGSGTFGSKQSIQTSFAGATDVVGVDLDGDDDIDVVATAYTGDELAWWANNGNGAFSAKQTIQASFNGAYGVASGDLDGDGDFDVSSVAFDGGEVKVFLNTPWSRVSLPAITGATGAIPADIDRDGDLDIVTSSAGGGEIAWWPNNGSGTFGTKQSIAATFDAYHTKTADFDGDNDLDILSAAYNGDEVAWWANNGSGTFGSKQSIQTSYNGAFHIAAADLDGDGDLDAIAGAYVGGGEIAWWANDGSGTFGTKQSIQTSFGGASGVQAADLDSDGDLDILATAVDGDEVAWWANNGSGTFGSKQLIASFDGAYDAAAGDLDGDGDLDVAAVAYSGDEVAWWANNGSGTFGAKQSIQTSIDTVLNIKLPDLDGDGDLDVLVAANDGNEVAWWANNGSGTFSIKETIYAPYTKANEVDTGDMDGDGDLDVLSASYSGNDVSVFFQKTRSSVKFQMRSHAADVTLASFVGPDGTGKTFFGSMDHGPSSMDGVGILTALDAKRYSQYRATFYRNDSALDPMIKNVQVDYTAKNYSTQNPYAESVGIGTTYSYLTSFVETATKPAGSEIKYQLSPSGGTIWKYYNGGWATSDGSYAQSSDAATIHANIATFEDNFITYNSPFKWRALLNSNGDVQPQLDALNIGYEVATIAFTSPNGGEIWKVGNAHGIHWIPTGVIPADLTLKYNNAGSAVIFPNTIATGVNPTHHNEEKIANAQGVWHFGTATSGAIANNATTGLEDTKGSAHGTAVNTNGTGMAFVAGKFGGGVDVSGDAEYVTFTNIPAMQGVTEATYSLWMKCETFNGDLQTAIVQSGGLRLYSIGAYLGFYDNLTGTVAGAGGALTLGNWIHIAGVFKAGVEHTLYVNGVKIASAVPLNVTRDASPNYIGNVVDGIVDEFAVFNRALTAKEIAILANTNPGYSWNAPVENSNQIRVWIQSPSTPAISDASDANATITDIAMTAPNGGDFWATANNYNVTWTAGTQVPNDLILEYTQMRTFSALDAVPGTVGADPKTSWVQLVNGSALNSQSGTPFNWASTPNTPGPSRVRVRSSSAPDLADYSDAVFNLSKLTVTKPNGGEILYEGEKTNITWTPAGIVPDDLRIHYTQNGTDFVEIANSVASAGSGQNPATIVPTGAVSAWRFNEASGGTTADSVGSNTGTLYAAPTFVAGKFGNALRFEGGNNTRFEIPPLNVGTVHTISMWLKKESNAADPSGECMLANAGHPAICIDLLPGYIYYYGADYPTPPYNGAGATFTPGVVGQWYHFAIVRNGLSVTFYKDGVALTNVSNLFSNVASTYAWIGQMANNYRYTGLMDDLAIWNRALTATEVGKLAGSVYEWTVPDLPSTTTKIRIQSLNAPALDDFSDANFEIRGRSVVLNAPNGTETYQEGSIQRIEWTPAGLLSNNLTLDYNKNGGSYTTIATGVDAGGSPLMGARGAWGFGEGTGQTLADKSGNSNAGTLGLTSSVSDDDPKWVLGKFGHALQFDGENDLVKVPNHATLTPTNQLTLSAWVLWNGHSLSADYQGILCKWSGYSYCLYYLDSSNQLTLALAGPTASVSGVTAAIENGQWHHVAATYNGAVASVYLDGVLLSSAASTGVIGDNVGEPVQIGFLTGVVGSSFNGLIDEPQIYKRVLTAAEIAVLASGKGFYNWKVPNDDSTQVKVRITDPNRAGVTDNSDANFTITSRTVLLNTPNGAETYLEGSRQFIEWTPTGPFSNNIELHYTKNGGAYTAIAATMDAGGLPLSGGQGAWGMGEGTGTSLDDKSPNANTGTLSLGTEGNTVAADAWRVGKFGNAIQFDGIDDSINIPNHATLTPTNQLTLSAWFLWKGKSVHATPAIVSKWAAGGTSFILVYDDTNNQFVLILDGTNSGGVTSNAVAVEDAQWHHVLGTYNGATATLYLDGISVGTQATTGNITSVGDLYIGSIGYVGSSFNGLIDEVQIYKRVLPAAEITRLASGKAFYSWKVPDDASAQVQVRVMDANKASINDFSNADFTTTSRSLLLNAPNGAETWQEGGRQFIEWSTSGPISNTVSLNYSKDFGGGISIATNLDAGGLPLSGAHGAWGMGEGTGTSFDDKSPNSNTGTLDLGTHGNTVVADAWQNGKFGTAIQFDGVDDTISVSSHASLVVTNQLTMSVWFLNKGTGSTVWPYAAGSFQNIINKGPGNGGYSIHYSYDVKRFTVYIMGTSLSTMNSNVVSVEDGQWHHVANVYDGATNTIYLDGVSVGSAAATGNITDPGYTLVIGGMSAPGFSFNGLLDEIQIYKRALSAAEITRLASGKGMYSWKVPNDENAQVLVQIRDEARTASYDNNDAVSAITPRTVAVSYPNGAETLPYNTVQYLKWDATGPLSNNLTLDLSYDSGNNYTVPNRIATGVDAGGVPLSGAQGAWGMGEGTGTSLDDKSPNSNTGTLVLGTNGNAVAADAWTVGKFGNALEFDGIDDYIAGSYVNPFNISGALTFSAWIKVAVGTPAGYIFDLRGSVSGGFNVLTWGGGIRYGPGGPGANDQAYSTSLTYLDGAWHHIAVVVSGTTATFYKDGVADGSGTTLSPEVSGAGSVFYMGANFNGSPNGPYKGLLDEVQVYNRALTVAEIAALASGKGVYPWTVPDPGFSAGTRSFPNVKVKVTDAARSATNDASNANANVVTPRFTITAPAAAAAIPFGGVQSITWTHTDLTQGSPVSSDLQIDYSLDDGANYPGGSQIVVDGSLGNGGPVTSPFSWGVPSNAVSSTVKVRIQDNVFPFGEGISSTFRVTGSVALTKPNGNEKWAVGFPHQITWQRNGNFTNVKIFTYDSDPNTPVTVISNSTSAAAGSFDWTPVAADAKAGLKIRVQDAADVDVYDDSNAVFSVSRVTVTNPSARLLADSAWTVNWTHVGLTNVKLEYSLLGDFSDAVTIVASTPAAALSYSNSSALKIPMKTTTTFKIRASDPDVPGTGDTALATDASDANATIYGLLVLQTPNGGEDISSGQPYDITWTVSPANANIIPNVLITAAKDGNFNNSTGGNIVTIAASNANHNNPGLGTGKFTWTPNFTSTLAKVRIADANDPSAQNAQNRDDSNGFFTISGISITTPAGGETALVNGSFGITFGFAGSVTNMDIHYSVDGGSNWLPIASNFNVPTNPYTYNWTPIPNAISTVAKIRVRDTNNPSLFAVSPNFNVKNVMDITTPVAVLKVGDPYTIQWSNTGTASSVKLQYTVSASDPGVEGSDPLISWVTIATPTGLTGAQTLTNQSLAWTGNIPNSISTTAKLRVVDTTVHANGSVASSATSGAFSIGAKLTLTSPDVNSVWGVNENMRNITWTSSGTVSNVKIEYLAENDSYVALGTVSNSTANDGAHIWNAIPDIVTLRGQNPQVDRDILVKLRISDADAGHPAAAVETAAFIIKWYRIVWQVRDADSSALLAGLGVAETDGASATTWLVTDGSLNATVALARNYQYATYDTTWSKTNYSSASFSGWVADSDKTNQVFLQNTATSDVEHRVQLGYTYDATTQIMNVKTWIEKVGKMQTTASLLGASVVRIYDGATLVTTLNDATADANGFYEFNYNNSGNALIAGKIYTANAEVTFNGLARNTGHSITISELSKLGAIATQVDAISTAVAVANATASAIDSKIGSAADGANANSIFGKVAAVKDTVGSVTDTASANTLMGKIAKNDVNVVKILDEVQVKIPKKIEMNSNKGGRGQMVKRNTRSALGQTAAIRFQHDEGLSPTADIYGPDNKLVLSAQPMIEVPGSKGVYNYDFKILTSYKKGDYTIIVTEPSTAFMDSMVISVSGTSEDDMGAAVASASSFSQSASASAEKAYTEIQAMKKSFGQDDDKGMVDRLKQMGDVMGQMRQNLQTLTGGIQEDGKKIMTVADVHGAVLDVMGEIKNMASAQGVNLDAVYKSIETQGESTTEIQNMVVAVEAISKTTQEMIEKAQDKPVMTTWFENVAA